METTTCGSTSLRLSAIPTYLMFMHCKSTTWFCEQDALSQHSAAGWFVCASCSHHAQRWACRRKTSAGTLAYCHILWFCTGSTGNQQSDSDLSCCSRVVCPATKKQMRWISSKLAHSLLLLDVVEEEVAIGQSQYFLSEVTEYATSSYNGLLRQQRVLRQQRDIVPTVTAGNRVSNNTPKVRPAVCHTAGIWTQVWWIPVQDRTTGKFPANAALNLPKGAKWNNSLFASDLAVADGEETASHTCFWAQLELLVGRNCCKQAPPSLSSLPTLSPQACGFLSSGMRERNLKQFAQEQIPWKTADFANTPVHLYTPYSPKAWS